MRHLLSTVVSIGLAVAALLASGCPSFDFENGVFACTDEAQCDRTRGETCIQGRCAVLAAGNDAGTQAIDAGGGAIDAGACTQTGYHCDGPAECCSHDCESTSHVCL
ncbi:MAG: hypothetical protein HY901_37920 [Deltaproteobacteria bacterium]|nr:hypothetical protein [Deltaproteobacteria bacterium]